MDDMTRKAFLIALAPLAACASAGGAPSWVSDFVDLLYRKKNVRAAFERYVTADYIQHSTDIASGREAAIAALAPMFARETFRADPIRVVADGDLVIVFLHVTVGAEIHALVIDIFRIDTEHIVEHWDIKHEIRAAEVETYFTRLG